jgi:hypothetical protein
MSRHLISTVARRATCPRCQVELLEAIDTGIATRVDAQPITTEQEIAALLEGRWTYLYRHQLLIYRDATIIAGGRAGTIHAEHRCPQKLTDELNQIARQREADIMRRQQELAKLRTELTNARTAGKAVGHATRLARKDPP